ncbi:four-carbon acid sugar kinase family protein [Actinopolymorpha alba]|uniref:four-carbon acid sugar kinase family protein n=1 Tax=Actinopolymorpha alba TaxID=533267 RepID=UPI00037A3604|nr:four-carbon acid sugar kinase family protein [Actinopolymorpha alba]
MRATVAVVADDLTGAADTGVGFLQTGLATTVAWAEPSLDTALTARTDVLAIDTRTRASGPDSAEARTSEVVASLRAAGVRTLYKKADSILRGHLGPEVKAALTAWEPGAVAVVALAFPGTGRTTVGGRQHVDGAPLDKPPIHELLERSGIATRHLDLRAVRAGDLAAAFGAVRATGIRALVCDAANDGDLRAIVRAGSLLDSPVVWVGSGGLAPALAANPALTGTPNGAPAPRPEANGSAPILVAIGSASDVARAQAARVAAEGATHVTIPAAALDGTNDTAGPAFADEIASCLRRGDDVVVTLGAETGARGGDDAGLARRLGELLRPCAPLVGGLVATGGDTATGVLRAWHTSALRLVEEVEPGVPLAISVAPRPIPVVTKAGAFGSTETLAFARARLKALLTLEGDG